MGSGPLWTTSLWKTWQPQVEVVGRWKPLKWFDNYGKLVQLILIVVIMGMYSNPQNERKVNLLRLSKNWLKAVEVVG